jgi:hypothetical protein
MWFLTLQNRVLRSEVLYAISRPEPESLLLTVNKIKKLVGKENVGTPVLLDQRLARPFSLDANSLPVGKENIVKHTQYAIVAFSYFRPPLRAEVLVRDRSTCVRKKRAALAATLPNTAVYGAQIQNGGTRLEDPRMGHRDRQ